jgi:hypothetical protein
MPIGALAEAIVDEIEKSEAVARASMPKAKARHGVISELSITF